MIAKIAIRTFLMGVMIMAGVAIWRVNYLIIVVPGAIFATIFALGVIHKIRNNG